MPVRPLLLSALFLAGMAAADTIYFQSHRGGLNEAPENTTAAFEHSWAIPGAIPETDLRTTRDGVLICLHDETLRRTVNAPPEIRRVPVTQLNWEQIAGLDAGSHFDAAQAGATVPRLEDMLAAMRGRPERLAWLDIKDADLEAIAALVDAHGVTRQALFVHGDQDGCVALRARFPEAEVMTWCSGSVESIRERYAALRARDFEGITILQFHLQTRRVDGEWSPDLGWEFLDTAHRELTEAGVALQVRPFDFDADLLRQLLDRGIRWFVSDDPRAFHEALEAARVSAIPSR